MPDSRPYFEKMQHLRTILDWSQSRMAREIGLKGDQQTVSKRVHEYETDQRAISGPIEKLIDRIAVEHNVNLLDF